MNPKYIRLFPLFLSLTACSFPISASAQTYWLQSFDGAAVQVQVFQQLSPRALAIACAKDTVFVYDYWAPDQINVLKKQFLQVTYAVRAGANEGLENTLLLCVDKGKLRQSMKVRTFHNYDMRNVSHIPGNPDEYELFQVQTHLLGTTAETYQVKLTIHDESRSQHTPAANHLSTKHVVFGFDAVRHIFYTSEENVGPTFSVLDPKAQRVITLKVKEPVPFIALNNSAYYFIKGKWYEKASSEKRLEQAR